MKEERAHLQKWEVVYVDTSGKFQVKSARAYFYYSVFVDRRMTRKLISVTLRSDISQLLSCSILYVLGVGRSCLFQMGQAIQELDTMMRASIHESNIPFKEWCFVVEYMYLIDMMTSYSSSNKSKTIF